MTCTTKHFFVSFPESTFKEEEEATAAMSSYFMTVIRDSNSGNL